MADTEGDSTILPSSAVWSGREPAGQQVRLEPGRELGTYRLVRMFGKGGFAEVWEAENLDSGRRVALKILTGARGATGEGLERFKREGRLAASLSHPRCVYVFGAEEIEGCPAISMEAMPGGTLQHVIEREGPIGYGRAVDYILDILDGLEAAHAAGILHRDVKPSNCFLDAEGRARIGDFGLSRALDTDVKLTVTGVFMGTPVYASPEQVRGRDVDLRSDLYSAGATLYAMLAGAPPYGGDQVGEVLARILSEAPAPLSSRRPDVPAGLQRVVMRMLAKDREARYASYAAARAALLPWSTSGLTAASIPRRIAAMVIDSAIFFPAGFVIQMRAMSEGLTTPAVLLGQAASLAASFVYFWVGEHLWGRTAGKAICGLYVTDLQGRRPGWGRAAGRTLVYLGLTALPAQLPALLLGDAVFTMPLNFLPMLAALAGYGVIASTIREGNGLAGVHDLASGTRVRRARWQRTAPAPRQARTVDRPVEEDRLSYGPYRVRQTIWRAGGEALLLGRDDLLGRDVWIHRFDDPARAPATQDLAATAAGRLRWLQGARRPGECWDAFEAPSGAPLTDWVRERGRLGWGETRQVLAGLAEAAEGSLAHGKGIDLALDRIWIDGLGRVRALDFPVRAGPASTVPGAPAAGWPAFATAIAAYCLHPEAAASAGKSLPAVPMPEHARAILGELSAPGVADAAGRSRLLERLEEAGSRPSRVTRARRAAPMAVVAFGVLLPAALMFFSLQIMSRLLPAFIHLVFAEQYLAQLDRMEASPRTADPELAEALRTVIAWSYVEFGRSPMGARTLEKHDEPTRRRLEAIAAGTPRRDDAQIATAIRKVESHQMARMLSPRVIAGLSLATYAALGVLGTLLAFVFRGGALLRLSGVVVQRSDGSRAGRWRCLARAAIAWSPALLAVLALRPGFLPFTGMAAALLAVAVVGAIEALAHPERSLADRLAGTWLVPK